MSQNRNNAKITFTGVVVTIVVTLGFIWAVKEWSSHDWPSKSSIKDIRANEIQAFKNLKRIALAQEKYRQTDWDKDGSKTYAKFFVHLWTSVSQESEPVPLGLIDKKLAFAMEASNASNGYFFIDLHNRSGPLVGKDQIEQLDYEREWAVTAVPAADRKAGFLIFIIDNSSDIFVKNHREVPSQYPYNPLSNGWTKIESIEQLKDFQKTLTHIN